MLSRGGGFTFYPPKTFYSPEFCASMNLRLILLAAALPAAASFALGGKIDGPGKPKAAAAAADVESGAVCKRMTDSTEDSVSTPFELGR